MDQVASGRMLFLRRWTMRTVFWLGAMTVGGFAVGFAKLCDQATRWHAYLADQSLLFTILAAPLGLIAASWATRIIVPGSEGSGIPQVIAALEVEPGPKRLELLSLPIATGKIVLTTFGIFCGASIGREGPTVHVGAAIMDALGRWMRFPSAYLRRSLVLAGAGAGLAAAFNTPIAGIVFAVEELARSLEERTTGTLLTAVVLAGVVSLGLLGNYTYFGVFQVHLPNWSAWLAVPVCGIAGGLSGGLFSRILISMQKRMAPLAAMHPIKLPLALGLMLVLLGLLSRGLTIGTGYPQARGMLGENLWLGITFPIMKAGATLLSYLSGIPGGIFSPTLATGAGLGALLAPLVPEAPSEAMVLLGMAAFFVGAIQSPLTGAVIVMEMVNDHELILPMLATSFLALAASRLVCAVPIYQALARNFSPPLEVREESP